MTNYARSVGVRVNRGYEGRQSRLTGNTKGRVKTRAPEYETSGGPTWG